MKKKITLSIATILFLIFILKITLLAQTDYLTVKGKVIKDLGTQKVQDNDITREIQKLKVRITEGEYKSEEYEMNYIISEDIQKNNAKNIKLNEDDNIIVELEENDGEITNLEFQEVVKTNYYIYMLAIFIILCILVGGKKGIKPILILLVILLTIYFIFIKNIKNGNNMLITALITELIILISTAMILNGFSRKMITNIISSVVSIGISGILMNFLFNDMKISLEIVDFKVNLNHVIALGTMISCTEISLAISTMISTYLEKEKQENPTIKVIELMKKGFNKGIETYTNTIGIPIIMYSCGITVLITLITNNSINNDNIALALAYLFSVLTGVILTIPITSAVYSLINRNKIFYKTKSDNIIKGQRSLKL